jgi:hypothetical protein
MLKVYLITAAILLALLGGSGLLLRKSYTRNGVLQTELAASKASLAVLEKQAKSDQALLKRRAAAEKAARAQAVAAQRELERSLSANPEWANAPIPQEVQDALTAKP